MTTPNKQQLITYTTANRIAIEASVYKRDFYEFVKVAWGIIDPAPFIDNWHVEALCLHLQAVADGKITRLLINVPPATAKSMIVSVLWPAWMWTHRPSWRSISTAHALDQAIRDTRKSRDLIRSEWYQARWPIAFKDDADRKGGYENTNLGFRVAKPFSSLTGERGNCVIIDDPHSVDTAKSDAERSTTVETFLEAVPTRLNDLTNDAIIVVMQRLHETDVAGTILERNMPYEHLCIPMEYEGDKRKTSIGWKDPRNREGQLMFPKKFPLNKVNELKASLGPLAYAGQHQQRPSPRDAGTLDRTWFKRFKLKAGPKDYKGWVFYMTSDHAPGGKGDYNVFRVWGIDHHRNLYLVDSFRMQCDMYKALGIERDNSGKLKVLPTGALALIKKWKPRKFFPEDDNTWKSVGKIFQQAMRESRVHVVIDEQSPSGLGDKVNKVQSYAALAQLGQVFLPEGPIGDSAIDEYVRFPSAKHDDQVDADGMIGRVYNQLHSGYDPSTLDVQLDDLKDYKPIKSSSADDSDSYWA